MTTEERPRIRTSSRTYTFVAVGFGILLTAILGFIVVNQWMFVAHVIRPVDDFAEKLSSTGLMPSTPKVVSLPVNPSPDEVFEITIEDKPIWVCYLDPADKKQADALALVRDHQTIELNGKPRPAKVHAALILLGFDDHPDEARILQAFAKLDEPKESRDTR